MTGPFNLRVSQLLVALTLFFAIASPAVGQALTPDLQRADNLQRAKDWAGAAAAYAAIVKEQPDNAVAWYGLASARYSLGQLANAAEAFRKNVALTKNPIAMFNLACVYARMGEKQQALDWLAKAVAPEAKAFYVLDLKDPDLTSLREEPRFNQISQTVDKLLNPCMYKPEPRQFDFWVGEWDAYNPQGVKTGTSVIQRIANGCGILENWSDRSGGGGGKSINFYDPKTGKWLEYWIGSDGSPRHFVGAYADGALRFEGEPYSQKGKNFVTRLTFFNIDANTVRQLSEQSDDGGKNWSVVYDFKYVRRNAASAAVNH
jgi:tetratricopeptide (TPR) repeat protein